MEQQLQKNYDKILNVVCEELNIKKRDILSNTRENDITFARALYMQLVKDLELNIQSAVILINKSRAMLYHYLEVAENELKHNRERYEHYKRCCKALGIEKKIVEPEKKEIEKNEDYCIRQKIGKLKKDNHYTLQEEILIERAKKSSIAYMRKYGNGVQPLMTGHAITRKKV